MSETEAPDNNVPHMPGPGTRLQAARESKSLTVEAVASQLKLTRGAVQALEAEQWDALHGRTYARGYFVIYVKFLGLPMDELLAQFDAQYHEPETTGVKVNRHSANDDRPFPWVPVSLLVIVLIVCLLAYQHWSDTQQSKATSDRQVPAPAEEQLDTDLIEPLDSPNTADEMQPQELESLSADPVDQTKFEPVEIDLSVLEDDSETPAISETAVAEQMTVANQATLTLTFNENSWVQVEDANTQVLISRIAESGETISLIGAAPLSVQLGRAQGVEVIYNEQRVDISDDIVGNVARFTLGG